MLVSHARQSRRLCMGRLMRPEEVAGATHGGAPDPAVVNGWYLCGELALEMFASADFNCVQHLGRTFEGPSGCCYVVWAQQCGHWQHRFILQLAGLEAVEYLASVQTAPIRLSLAQGDSSKAVLLRGPDALRSLVPPALPVHSVPQDVVALSLELIWVTAKMLALQAVRDPLLPEVRNVCVSAVHTNSVLDALRAQKQRDAGAGLH